MISDSGRQHDGVQLPSSHHDSTSHLHIKSNTHTKLVIPNTMELDKARYFYNGCFNTRLPTPCKQCCQVRVHKQNTNRDASSLTCQLSPLPTPRPQFTFLKYYVYSNITEFCSTKRQS